MIGETRENYPGNQKEKENKYSDYELFKKKYLISSFVTGEKLGSQNIYQAAINLYAALYGQEKIDELIEPSEKFPERMDAMKSSLSSVPKVIPKLEEFITEFRRVLTRKVDYGDAVSESTKKQLFDIMRGCEHTVIWTDGDTEGVPEKGLPGSREQLYKLGSAQFYNKMRQEIAQERQTKRRNVLTVVSAEGKMKRIPDIVKKFIEIGIEKVLVVEDRIKNLKKALQTIEDNSAIVLTSAP